MMIRRIEDMNQMILKHGLEGLSEEYQAYWDIVEQINKRVHEEPKKMFERTIFFKTFLFIGYSAISFGLLYLLAVLMHYMMS